MIRILLLTDSIDSKLSIDIYFILFSVCEETMMEKKAALENYPMQCDELVDINERNFVNNCQVHVNCITCQKDQSRLYRPYPGCCSNIFEFFE